MPGAKRRLGPAVAQQLLEQPHRFGFFQALRLLGQWRARRAAGPGAASMQRVRFGSSLSLSFAPGEIEALEATAPGADGAAPEQVSITPAFIGLLGQSGALPLAYTERLAEREVFHRDRSARAFLDIFNDRAVALFHAAWLKHRPAMQHSPGGRDRLHDLLLALAGMGGDSRRQLLGRGEGPVFDQSIAHHAGLLRQRPLSAAALGRVLGEHFQLPLQVEQFVGAWYALPPGQQTRLGRAVRGLGQGAVCGARVYQRDLRLRLSFGPLHRTEFDRLLPGAPGARALSRWLGLLGGIGFEYEVRLRLRAEAVQPARLCGNRGRLGLDAFLLSTPSGAPRDDTGYLLQPSH